MSLKAFHIVFISASILLALGFGGWSFRTFFTAGGFSYLIMAATSLVVTGALIVYEKNALRKFRKLG